MINFDLVCFHVFLQKAAVLVAMSVVNDKDEDCDGDGDDDDDDDDFDYDDDARISCTMIMQVGKC